MSSLLVSKMPKSQVTAEQPSTKTKQTTTKIGNFQKKQLYTKTKEEQQQASRKDTVAIKSTQINTEIRLIIFFAAEGGKALYSQHKQYLELTVAQNMSSFLQNSDLNGRK